MGKLFATTNTMKSMMTKFFLSSCAVLLLAPLVCLGSQAEFNSGDIVERSGTNDEDAPYKIVQTVRKRNDDGTYRLYSVLDGEILMDSEDSRVPADKLSLLAQARPLVDSKLPKGGNR